MGEIGRNQRFSRKSALLLGGAHHDPTRPTSRPGPCPGLGPGLISGLGTSWDWGLAEYCFLIILDLGGRNNYLFFVIY